MSEVIDRTDVDTKRVTLRLVRNAMADDIVDPPIQATFVAKLLTGLVDSYEVFGDPRDLVIDEARRGSFIVEFVSAAAGGGVVAAATQIEAFSKWAKNVSGLFKWIKFPTRKRAPSVKDHGLITVLEKVILAGYSAELKLHAPAKEENVTIGPADRGNVRISRALLADQIRREPKILEPIAADLRWMMRGEPHERTMFRWKPHRITADLPFIGQHDVHVLFGSEKLKAALNISTYGHAIDFVVDGHMLESAAVPTFVVTALRDVLPR